MSDIDLHIHSTGSLDADFSPSELLEMCAQNDMKTVAILDHNTTQSVKEAQAHGDRMGIEVIPAIEVDALFRGVSLHILGYWIDPDFPEFTALAEREISQEKSATQTRMRIFNELGVKVGMDDVNRLTGKDYAIGETLAEVALQLPENEGCPLLLPYRPGGARSNNPISNIYWDFFAQGGPAHVPFVHMDLPDVVSLINRAGGVTALAHPGNNVKEDGALLDDVVSRGVQGIEAFSSYHTPAQVAYYRQKAADHRLFLTCGSDFHGRTKPRMRIGSVECDGMEDEILATLRGFRQP